MEKKQISVTYAYTLIVPAGQLVRISVRYRDLSACQQKAYLEKMIVNNVGDGEYTINFEKHKDGRYHCHGHITYTARSKPICNGHINYMRILINALLLREMKSDKFFHYKEVWYADGWTKYEHKDILLNCDLSDVLSDSD